ncbi:MFS transporter [Heyndrickxia acidicola]|uniref:MFS transporter n=1 Tax=Heyndrickxia acidicola TaxID=209389 RepID=A0ABU6MF64_9BACI|nr:MFS transporter [Heyndrickxia acidicola]MED1203306.1 MFS transporter [Heyndrickxia acidicola]
MKSFIAIWAGQFGSLIGSSLTSFALGVYVLQKTGSVSQFSFILLCMTVPGLVLAPLAGVLVDKWSRKRMMIASDLLAGFSTLGIAAILFFSHLELWQIYLSVALSSIAGIIQFPAYQAIVSQLVEKKHLGRANGLIQLSDASGSIIAPPLAGILLPLIHLKGIFIIDFFSFFLAIFSILFIPIPHTRMQTETSKKQSILQEMKEGLDYLLQHKGLLWLLTYFAFTNFLFGFVNVYTQPLILSLGTTRDLGFVLSCLGTAMVAGGAVMSAWGGPKRKALGVLFFGVISAFFFTLIGVNKSIFSISVFLFLSFFFLPFGNSCSQVIWQSKVETNIQGRVFALRRMIAMSLMPVSYLLSGPLEEKILAPLMEKGQMGQQLLGGWLGSGEAGGIRLFYIAIGISWILLSLLLWLKPEIKGLDEGYQKEKKLQAAAALEK